MLRDAVREQGVTTSLVQGLDLAVDAESARLAEPQAEEDAAARAERTARRAVLDEENETKRRAGLFPAAQGQALPAKGYLGDIGVKRRVLGM